MMALNINPIKNKNEISKRGGWGAKNSNSRGILQHYDSHLIIVEKFIPSSQSNQFPHFHIQHIDTIIQISKPDYLTGYSGIQSQIHIQCKNYGDKMIYEKIQLLKLLYEAIALTSLLLMKRKHEYMSDISHILVLMFYKLQKHNNFPSKSQNQQNQTFNMRTNLNNNSETYANDKVQILGYNKFP
jgi:hypothetical protein